VKKRKRNKAKYFYLSEEENEKLKAICNKCAISESDFFRLSIQNVRPVEQPKEEIYQALRELSSISNNINQLARRANAYGIIDANELLKEKEKWENFMYKVEKKFFHEMKEGD